MDSVSLPDPASAPLCPPVRPAVERPAVLAAMAYLAGVALGRVALAPLWAAMVAAAALAAIPTLRIAARARQREGPPDDSDPPVAPLYPALAALALVGLAASNAAIRTDARAAAIAARFEDSLSTVVVGTLAETPRSGDYGTVATLGDATVASPVVESGPTAFPLKIRATIRDPTGLPDGLHRGVRLEIRGRLRPSPPHAARSDGDTFDFAAYLAGQGVGATLHVPSGGHVRRLEGGHARSEPFFGFMEGVADRIRRNIRLEVGEADAGLALALLLGDRTDLPDETREAFRRCGLTHVFSVSGLHAGFVLIALVAAARVCGLGPRAAAVACGVGIAFYAGLVGFRPPVVRAATMAGFLLVGHASGRPAASAAAIAAAAWATLAADPRNILRADWILSYSCAASMVLFAPTLYESLQGRNEDMPGFGAGLRPRVRAGFDKVLAFARRTIALPFVATATAMMGILPFQANMFGTFPFSGLLLQWALLPFAGVAVIAAGVAGLFGAPLSVLAGPILGVSVRTLRGGAEALGGTPFAEFPLAPMPWWGATIYALGLAIGPHVRRGRPPSLLSGPRQRRHAWWRFAWFLAAALLLGLVAIRRDGSSLRSESIPADGALELRMLNVGQGDAILLRFPDGRWAAIDGGRADAPEGGRTTPARYLREMGVRRLAFVLATHADADHIGGLDVLLREFEVDLFLHGPDRSDSLEYEGLLRTVRERGIPIAELWAGDRIGGFGETEILVANPEPGQDNNDASVVLVVDFRDVEIVLTGDVSMLAEARILERGYGRDVEILKVAHHGSATSTTPEFLDAFDPELALIGVGARNPYGHPAAQVLRELESREIDVFRTDEDGTIVVRTDGATWSVEENEP